jgi:transcriptional regulator with PAS, ATPase and Fis domain
VLVNYLPDYQSTRLPAVIGNKGVSEEAFNSEREILYKVLFDMKNDMNDLKKLVVQMLEQGEVSGELEDEHEGIIKKLYSTVDEVPERPEQLVNPTIPKHPEPSDDGIMDTEEIVEESLSLEEKEIELIRKALAKHNGKRKYAAQDLGISERTLYRKIKEYQIE